MMSRDYAALEGRAVTDGHVRACHELGHATHTVDGRDSGTCPRCGEVTEDSATVEIADVFADAVRVRVESVKTGDYVFDVFGGRHKVANVTSYGSRGHVDITRKDGWSSHHQENDEITIVRGEQS